MGRVESRRRERDARTAACFTSAVTPLVLGLALPVHAGSAMPAPRQAACGHWTPAAGPVASAFRSACLLVLVLLLGAGAAQAQQRPVATGATVNGKQLVITFDQDLDTTQVPAANRFRYSRGGSAALHNPESVAMATRTVTLTLAHTITRSEVVSVRYIAPASGGLQSANGVAAADFDIDPVVNDTPDTTPPQPLRAYTDPGGVVVEFTEELSSLTSLSETDFTVKVDGAVRPQNGKPLIARTVMLLRLSRGIAHGETATVSYSGTTLSDERGTSNRVQPFTDLPVENRAPPPASITSVAITSTPGWDRDNNGTPDTYRRHEAIEVTVTWDKDVTWNVPSPDADLRVRLDMNSGVQVARLVTGGASTGTARSLKFRHSVTRTDLDADGIFPKPHPGGRLVLSPSAEGTLVAAGRWGWPAQVTHPGLAADANHKVDGSTVDSTAPSLSSAKVVDDTLTLTYNERLDEDSKPDTGDFTVTVAGANRGVNTVEVSGKAVTLTLASAAVGGQAVTTSYAKGTKPIQDLVGNHAGNLTNRLVDNLGRRPHLVSTFLKGATMRLTFNKHLDHEGVLGQDQFQYRRNDEAVRSVKSVSITGRTVVLRLWDPVTAADTLMVNYIAPSSGNRLRDTVGIAVESFTFNSRIDSVTEETPEQDQGPPLLVSATVNGATLTLTFDEALDDEGGPGPGPIPISPK